MHPSFCAFWIVQDATEQKNNVDFKRYFCHDVSKICTWQKMTVKNRTGPKPVICNSVTMDILQNIFHSLWFKLFGGKKATFSDAFTNAYWRLATEGFTLKYPYSYCNYAN